MPHQITSINLDRHLARAGAAAQSFARLWENLWQQRYLSPELLELCRLTFARMHRDADEGSAVNPFVESSEAKGGLRTAVLEDRALDDPAMPSGWRAVLLFAEYYWTDVQSITDEVADEVKHHHGEPGLVLLIEALGCIDGRIRTARCLRDISAHRSLKEVAHAG